MLVVVVVEQERVSLSADVTSQDEIKKLIEK